MEKEPWQEDIYENNEEETRFRASTPETKRERRCCQSCLDSSS